MTLDMWARHHNISPQALYELRHILGVVSTEPPLTPGESEAAIQNHVRLEASTKGLRMWRNNVGVLNDERGIPVRFGLCNDSKQMNQEIKSSDLIGIRPVLIKPQHVGSTIGQFVAREVKAGSWKWSGSKREKAQLKFLELIISLGGDGAFANSEGTL